MNDGPSFPNNNPASLPAAANWADQLRAATELLEKVAGDRAVLAQLSLEERTRLLTAVGEIYCPDLKERRRLVKARVKQRKAEKLQRDQSKLHETGIRKLRREKVFAYRYEGKRYDCGSKLGFLEATVELALHHPEVGADFTAYLAQRC